MTFTDLATHTTQISKEYKEKFLDMNHTEYIRTAPKSTTNLYYIYVIENLKSGKKYIGKTQNIFARASDYTRKVRNANSYDTKKYRAINRALLEEGIENFLMYPIATCDGTIEAGILEVDIMRAFNTFVPNGYNIRSAYDFTSYTHREGHPHSVETKMKKSKLVMCINPELKALFLSVGMKLFGDFTNVTKDVVKNSARRPCMHKGYYIIYLNDIDRIQIADTYRKRMENPPFKLSKDVELYLSLSERVGEFAHNPSLDVFKDYTQNFLTYNPNPSMGSETYLVEPMETFLEMINPQSTK